MNMRAYYRFGSPTRVISGKGAIGYLDPLLTQKRSTRVLLLTDRGIMTTGLDQKVLEHIGSGSKAHVDLYDEVPQDSSLESVTRVARKLREETYDTVIALGGGSVMDTAKAAVLSASNPDLEVRQLAGADRQLISSYELIAIPTTCGTGSECTKVAVILDTEAGRKLLVTSDGLLPQVAILDPEMVLTLPGRLKAAVASDAIAHAIEAYTGLGKNPISDAFCIEALERILSSLFRSIEAPEDQDAALDLLIGSNLAGRAFSNSMVGVTHMIGHSAGSLCHIPHGVCMGILLPYGIEYNQHLIEKETSQLSSLFRSYGFMAQGLAEQVRDLGRRLSEATDSGHATCFHDVFTSDGQRAIRPDQFSLVARLALDDGAHFTNPEEVGYQDVVNILQAAYWGYPLDRSLIDSRSTPVVR